MLAKSSIHLSEAYQLGKLFGKGILRMGNDVRKELSREYEYCFGMRPRALLILTWACTSRCATCTIWRRPRDASRELTCDEWLAVARKLVERGVRSVELFGGDVLLRKDVVIPLARELKSLGCRVNMPTNCNLLDEQTAADLVDCMNHIYLSIDGVDELQDRIRGVAGTFDKVCRALRFLKQARGSRDHPILICNTTVSRHNVRNLSEIAEFAKQVGFDEINFEYVGEIPPESVLRSRIGDYVPSPSYVRLDESSLVPPEEISTLRCQLRQAKTHQARPSSCNGFRTVTIDTDVLSDAQLVKGTIPWRRCFVERTAAVINPYGNIVPCCFFDDYVVGNVRNGDLDRSWETPKRVRFRACRESGGLEMCKHCSVSIVRNRSMSDVIRRAYIENIVDPLDQFAHQVSRR